MIIGAETDGRVACTALLHLELSSQCAWGQLRDFRRFASHDYFHQDVRVEHGRPRPGARLLLAHQFGLWRVRRHGRILVWREGIGFAFSDLSLDGPHNGFPHVLMYRLEPVSAVRSCLHITVRGRWTAGWIPVWARRLWLAWVFQHIVASARNELLLFAATRNVTRRRSKSDVGNGVSF